MKQFKKTKYFIIAAIIFLGLTSIANAGLVPCTGPDSCNFTQLGQMLMNVIMELFKLAIIFTGVGFAWAGFLYLTAGGDSGQIKKAHNVFGKIIIGFLILCCSFLIVNLIAATLKLNVPIQTLYNRIVPNR